MIDVAKINNFSQAFQCTLQKKICLVVSVALTIIITIATLYIGISNGAHNPVFYSSASILAFSLAAILSLALFSKKKSLSNQRIATVFFQEGKFTQLAHVPRKDFVAYRIFEFDDGFKLEFNQVAFEELLKQSSYFKRLNLYDSIGAIIQLKEVEPKALLLILHEINGSIEFDENILSKFEYSRIWGFENLENQYSHLIKLNLDRFSHEELVSLHDQECFRVEICEYFNNLLKKNLSNLLEFEKLTTFLKDKEFNFKKLDFSNCGINEKHLEKLKGIHCEELDLSRTYIHKPNLQEIKGLHTVDFFYSAIQTLEFLPTTLISLNISYCPSLFKEGEEICIQSLKNLKILKLNSTKVKDLSFLKALSITELELIHCVELPKSAFTVFSSLDSLEKLDLSYTPIDSLDPLSKLHLQKLSLMGCRDLAPASFACFREFSVLKVLNLDDTQMSSLENIQDLPLEELSLARCFQLKDFKEIAQLKKLESLNLNECSIDSLLNLKDLPLKKLSIKNCKQLSSFEYIQFLGNLQELAVYGKKITSLGFLGSLPLLHSLHLSNFTDLSPGEFQVLAKIKTLKSLTLFYADIDSLDSLVELPLENLEFTSCRKLSRESLLNLKKIKTLKTLSTDSENLSLEAMTGLTLDALTVPPSLRDKDELSKIATRIFYQN